MRAAALASLALLAACGRPAEQPAAPAPTDAQRALAEAGRRMHAGMAVTDRDPDAAFARGMVAHHKGAIEMARVELRYGRDPTLRALAAGVIRTQQAEVATMERWLATHAAAPAAGDGRH